MKLKSMVLGCALAVASSLLAVDLENVSNGDIVLGEWNSNFSACKSYAEANKIPLFVFWSNPGCAKCNKMKTACNSPDFVAWRKSAQFVMVFSEGDLSVKPFVKNSSGHFPYMRLYWPAGNVDSKFSGRSGEIPGKGSTLQAMLMNALDTLTAGYKPGPNPNPNPNPDPTPDPTPVIGSEWSKARKLFSAIYDEKGSLIGQIEVKTAKVGKSGVRKGQAKVSAKVMLLDGRSKALAAAYAKVDTTTSVSLSGAAGSVKLSIKGSSINGSFSNAAYSSAVIKAGKVGGALASGKLTFEMLTHPTTCEGLAVIRPNDFLPIKQSFTCSGTKWTFPRKGTLRIDSSIGNFTMSSMDNPSGLKLSYKSVTGYFKGSFYVYAKKAAAKAKRYTASVTGFIVNGEGNGIVTIRNVGSYSCAIVR